MSDRIDGIANTFRMPTEHSQQETLQDPQGNWHGESVEVGPRDALSLLQDAKRRADHG